MTENMTAIGVLGHITTYEGTSEVEVVFKATMGSNMPAKVVLTLPVDVILRMIAGDDKIILEANK